MARSRVCQPDGTFCLLSEKTLKHNIHTFRHGHQDEDSWIKLAAGRQVFLFACLL